MQKVILIFVLLDVFFNVAFYFHLFQGGQYNNYGQPQGYQQQQNPYGPPPQYPPHGYPGGWGGRPAPPPGVDPVLWDWFQVKNYPFFYYLVIAF